MPEYTPQALLQLDDTIGSRTAEAYHTAVDAHPYLRDVRVVLNPDKRNFFSKSVHGLSASYISLNPTEAPYIERIEAGEVEERYSWAVDLLGYDGVTPRVPELLTTIFLHELGHANDFQGYITNNGDNPAIAFERSKEARRLQLATLPLKQASSRAIRAWDSNTEGYRDQLRASGLGDEDFSSTIRVNTAAYAELPCEAVADRFALGILSSIYTFAKQT